MITKYRKRPVIVEVVQWTGNVNKEEINAFIGKDVAVELLSEAAYQAGQGLPLFNLIIPTLEGTMTASPNDYIIKGVEGEFYPCKPDIFHRTYEEVEDGIRRHN